MKRSLPMMMILIILLSACSALGPKATKTPLPPEPSPTQTQTPEPTATPTKVNTPTAAPTSTATPTPTATPEGFYLNNDLGFSMQQVGSWYLDSEEPSYVVFSNDALTIMTWVDSQMPSTDISMEEYAQLSVEDLANALEADSYTLGELEEITITDEEIPAGKLDVDFTGNLDFLAGTIVLVDQFGHYYFYFFLGPDESLQPLNPQVTAFLDTFTFFKPKRYGLEPDQTLYRLGRDPDDNDIDPAIMTGSAGGYPGLLFAGLVALKPDLSIVPDLALDWKISEGGTVYTFNLRQDIQFSSGKAITAEDVKNSWERATDPEMDSPTARTYLGDILGVEEKLAGEADEISGVEVIDETTLKVTLTGPKPYFLAKLSYPTSFVVNTDQIEEDENWWEHPDASGPYIIKEYEENQVIVFERNPAFYTEVEVPFVAYNLNPGGTQISLFETEDLDIAFIGGEDVLRMQDENEPLRDFMNSTTSMCTDMIKIDNTMPPFDDINVRRAFALALDPNAINEQFSEGLDRIAAGLLPPAMPGYTPENKIEPFNVEAAQEALAASDYADDMPEIVISSWGYGDTDSPYVAMLIDTWRQNLGVEVTVEYIDPDDFSQIAREEHGQLVVSGWCADYPDPQNFLEVLFHTNSEFNVSGYTNTAFDELVEEAAVKGDTAARIALYQEAETLLLEDFALIPITHNVSYVLVSDKIQDFFFSPTGNIYARWLSFAAGE